MIKLARQGRNYQTFRGNPEQKLFYIVNNFLGGINTEFSDDSSDVTDFETIINFDMDKLGTLNKRGGFGEINALSEIFNKLDINNDFPVVHNRTEEYPNPEDTNDNIIYMKLLRNDNNCFRNLAGFTGENAYRKYQQMYGFQNNSFKLLIITSRFPDLVGVDPYSVAWLYQCSLPELQYENGEPTNTDTMTITCNKVILPVVFSWDRNLMNLETIEFYDKIYFTGNDKCLVSFDRSVTVNSDQTLTNAFSYSGYINAPVGINKSTHTPSGLEVRHIGFNVLCDDPLHDIDTQGISTDSIQGVFVCTTDNKPLLEIPLGQKFLLNIIYTNETNNNFDIEFKEGDNVLTFESAVNSTLSRNGLKVYEIKFKDVPSGEVEIKITKTGATLEPYYDYYSVAQPDKEAKTVSHLNIGDYGICEMYNRAVYYKNDTIWFSDVNNFNYIPNYNYVTLPIEPTDKITKICYFKKSYIIFTKQRIYKMVGSFGTSDFALQPVNTSLGCHAGNTVIPIEDTLYFSSPRGLYALRSSQFVEGFENVKELDLKVKKLTSDFTKYSEELNNPAIRYNGVSERAYATRYKDKYLLFYNNYNDKGDYAAMNDLDVLCYQFDIGAFTTYRFKEKPTFLFMVDNAIENFSIQKEDELYTDEEILFNYDFQNNGITDLSSNHNDATIVGDLPRNKGVGLSFDGANDYAQIGSVNGSNFRNGYFITLDMKLNNYNTNTDETIFDFTVSERIPPTTVSGTISNIIGNEIEFKLEYTITPNSNTFTDTVSYRLIAKKLNGTFNRAVLKLYNYKLEAWSLWGETLIDNSNYIEKDDLSQQEFLLDSGVFSYVRTDNNKEYHSNWRLYLNFEAYLYNFAGGPTATWDRATYSGGSTNIDLGYPYSSTELINLDKSRGKSLILSFSTTSGSYRMTFQNVLDGDRHLWGISIVRNTSDYTISLYKDLVLISSQNIDEKYISNNIRDLCYLGCKSGTGHFFNGEIYKFAIGSDSLNDKNVLYYDFWQGTGTSITDIHGIPATINGCTWLTISGFYFNYILHGGYLRLPAFNNVYFSNGFKIEFTGIIDSSSYTAGKTLTILDLATTNNPINDINNYINVSAKDNILTFSTLSSTYKTYKVSTPFTPNVVHDFLINCVNTGNGYTISMKIDDVLVNEQSFRYGGIIDLDRINNFIGTSVNGDLSYSFGGSLSKFKITVYASSSPIIVYRAKVCEFDTTPTDFGKPIYLELKTKGLNMNYPQHLKKLKHIFVKAIGGYNYGELFFTLFGDGYIVNDPKIYSYYINEEGQVVQDYEYAKNLSIDERVSLLGNMRLDKTKLGEGTYQLRKLIIPKKCKNFALLIYGDSNDYISLESFGFVLKLGKVKEG